MHTVRLPYYDRLDYVCRLRSLLCSTTLDYSDRLDYVCRLHSLLCSTTLDYSDRLDYVCRLRSLHRGPLCGFKLFSVEFSDTDHRWFTETYARFAIRNFRLATTTKMSLSKTPGSLMETPILVYEKHSFHVFPSRGGSMLTRPCGFS